MAELKPCPFCGGRAFVDVFLDTEYVSVEHCAMCLVKPSTWTMAYADEVPLKIQIKAWNRRTEDDK